MRAKARASTVRHNWLAAISMPQTTIDAAVISVHITAQRISAPSPIAIVVRCARSYSVATWSTCARSISAGGIAASGESANTFAASMRVGRQRVDDGAAARQLGDCLCAGAHVERPEDRTDVHLHRTFRQPKVATDQLVPREMGFTSLCGGVEWAPFVPTGCANRPMPKYLKLRGRTYYTNIPVPKDL